MKASSLFSESWYRVSQLELGLLPTVRVHKQYFRGERWYLLHDPYNNRYFRVRPEAYRFIIRMTPNQKIEDLWQDSLLRNPEETPSQDEVIGLLSQLHHANLLYYKNRPNTEYVFKRQQETKKKELKQKLISILFYKVPVWDPEEFLRRNLTLCHLLVNRWIGFLVLACFFAACWICFTHHQELFQTSQGVLAPANVFWLYIVMIVMKLLHEMGHAIVTKRFGGEVHIMGIMFLVFTPLPYMDASSSWAFRNKWHRVLVGSAGIIVELFLASVATFVWASTGEGLINSLAFNVMLIGSVSSLIFNGNPLTRLDSYYILSDWLEIPNLAIRAREQWIGVFQRYLLFLDDVQPIAKSYREAFWLLLYGFFSFLYRIVISVGIAVFVMDQWFALGVVIIVMSVFMWVLMPIYKGIDFVLNDPKLLKKRSYAVTLTLTGSFACIGLLGFYPVSDHVMCAGIVQKEGFQSLYLGTGGQLKKILVEDGSIVSEGQILVEFDSPELEHELLLLQAQLQETSALKTKAQSQREGNVADLKPLQERENFLKDKLENLMEKKGKLVVRSPKSGIWVGQNLKQRLGSWCKRGQELGLVLPQEGNQFVAVLLQEDASDVFRQSELKAELKLSGVESQTYDVDDVQVLPYEKRKLPSASLGWFGGGNIPVKQGNGKEAAEAFYEIKVDLSQLEDWFLHNRKGYLSIELPPSSLIYQFSRGLKKILQKRYKV